MIDFSAMLFSLTMKTEFHLIQYQFALLRVLIIYLTKKDIILF